MRPRRCSAATAKSARAGPDEAVLQLLGLVFGADMGQVAGYRVTPSAAARAVKVSFARLGIAGHYVEAFVDAAIGHQLNLQVQVLCDIGELGLREGGERRHAFVGAPF